MKFETLRRLLFAGLLAFFSWHVHSQPAFTNVADELGSFGVYSPLPFHAGGVSIRDFDNDGWDDLTLCSGFGSRIKFFKNYFGTFKEITVVQTNIGWHLYAAWVDYDNDGDLDFFGLSDLGGAQVYRNDGSFNFTEVSVPLGFSSLVGAHLAGATFADFNNDGLVDVYFCRYDPFNGNKMFFQRPNNTFEDVTLISGTSDSLKFAFEGVVLDYNHDGWMDLYIANDGNLVANTLFKNNGDSTFTDVSALTGANVYIDAMGMAIGDFDGDLDLDIHITDKVNSKLIRLDSNATFTEVASQTGTNHPGGFGWGNNFFDADLDGDEDLYISCNYWVYPMQTSTLCLNDGTGNFTYTSLGNDSNFSFTNVIGDFNNDRLSDIIVLNSFGQSIDIWKNEQVNPPPRFTVAIEGCSTHKDASGSQIIAYDGPDARMYVFQASQSFLGQNSQKKIIPILNGNSLDSLKVIWPDGSTSIISEINPNQTIIVSECATPKPLPVILVPNYPTQGLVSCSGDSILLKSDGQYQNVLWSNGETTDSIYVSTAGSYAVNVVNQFGVSATSSPVTIIDREYPEYIIESETAGCFNDGSIQVFPTNLNTSYSYTWDTGESGDSLTNLIPGTYYFTATDQEECAVEDSITIDGPANFTPIRFNGVSENALCYDESSGVISVFASGGSAPYEYLWSTQDTTASITVPAGSYHLTITDSYQCQRDTSFNINEPSQVLAYIDVSPDTNLAGLGMIVLDIFGGTPPYSIEWQNAQNQTGISAQNLTAGEYNIQITDAQFCERNIEVSIPNISLTNTIEMQDAKCDFTCINLPSSVLVQFSEKCDPSVSEEPFSIFNLQGQSLQYTSNPIDAHSTEILLDQSGVFFISSRQGQTCKIVRL